MLTSPSDPRPDLATDTALWQKVLYAAWTLHGWSDFYWTLEGVRCWGAEMTTTKKGTLAIRKGEMTDDEYNAIRTEYLVPIRGDIAELLSYVTTGA